jgi:hypothetical protein
MFEYPYVPVPARPPSACAAVRCAAPPTSAVGIIGVCICVYIPIYISVCVPICRPCITHTARECRAKNARCRHARAPVRAPVCALVRRRRVNGAPVVATGAHSSCEPDWPAPRTTTPRTCPRRSPRCGTRPRSRSARSPPGTRCCPRHRTRTHLQLGTHRPVGPCRSSRALQ